MSAAVHHILRQMQRDARLAWLIGPGSRTYELLTEEAATANGLNLEELREQHAATLKFSQWPTELRVDIDPEAILLPRPAPSKVRWFGEENAYYSPHIFMERHHIGPSAPYWRGHETRKTALGFEKWRSAPRFYVANDFGTLVEVRL